YEQAGEYKVRFAVFDPQGASDTIDVTLKVDNVNRSPSLKVSNHNAVLGKELKFNLIGSDPDLNTTLTYSVTDLPEGATFNPTTGEFRWLPNPGQVGDYPLTFGVSDGESSVTERVLIHGAIAPEPLPVTIELTPSFPAIPGQKVLIHAIATSLADIATINLSVNGQPLTLDSQGRGEFTPATPGQYLVTAKATDVDGFAGQTTSIIKVRHPQDNLPPVVAFLNNLEGEKITNITSIVGTVADLNLDEWSLELASLGSNDYVKLAGGNQAIATAPLTQLDPTTLSNGFYQLKLNATDISGRTSLTTAIIEINTSQKSSQYQRSETDLTVTLDGVNLDLIRAYDSLNSSQSATFGQGWRLTNTDTQIQTNVPSSGRENLGVYNPFRVGTRLYLTLPNGERVGFTFQPQRQEIPGLVYYTPAWVADTGVNYTLQSQNALLSLAGERLYELKTGQPYNLSSHALAGKMPAPPAYILTAPDGTIYHLDATGKVQAQITPNGVKLTYSDSGIISPSGESVSFIEDAEGRLSQISAPDGRIVTYKYDAQGNLINARNLALAQSNYYSYAADHRLTLVAAANQPGATISYNIPQPQVITLTGNLGSAFQFNPTVTQGQFQTGESQHYSFSVRQSEVNSTATGIVLLGVEVKGNN
ncbi:MAG: putative Ig domain-containing protein, partial [Microcystis panniformis]